tara:strand:+ start:545 stop:1165 length:621 start_codon:yes stop_codon:yes gene_type:complete
MRLTNLVALLGFGCTSDYTLNLDDGGVDGGADIPQYSLQDLDDDNPSVSYDPCDPNDQGWADHPEGSERNDCYALLGDFREIEGYGFCTKIYFGGCFDEYSNLEQITLLRDNSNQHRSTSYTVSCGDDDRYLFTCFDLDATDESESASVEVDIYLLSMDDKEFLDSEGISSASNALREYLQDSVAQALHLTMYRSASGTKMFDLRK